MNLEDNTCSSAVEKKVMVTVPDDDLIQHWFTYHKPTETDISRYKEIRDCGLEFARKINDHCPDGPDKSVAIRKVREAVMTANAAIACCGKQ